MADIYIGVTSSWPANRSLGEGSEEIFRHPTPTKSMSDSLYSIFNGRPPEARPAWQPKLACQPKPWRRLVGAGLPKSLYNYMMLNKIIIL